MPQELLAALVGATMSALLMVLSNRTNKRQSDIREIFHRLNAIEKNKPVKNLTGKETGVIDKT